MSKCPCDLNTEIEYFIGGQSTVLFHVLLQGDTVNKFHDDVFNILVVAHIIHRNDVRVRQHCDCLRLGPKAPSEALVRRSIVTHYLDRIVTV